MGQRKRGRETRVTARQAEREGRNTEGQRRGNTEDDGGQSDPLKRDRVQGTEVGDKDRI